MQIVITPCLSELYHSFQSLAPCSGPHEVCFLCNHYLCRAYRPQIIFLTDDLNCFLQTHSYIMSATYKQNKKCFILCPLVFLFPYFTEKKKKKQTNLLFWKLCLLSCSHQLGLLLPQSPRGQEVRRGDSVPPLDVAAPKEVSCPKSHS